MHKKWLKKLEGNELKALSSMMVLLMYAAAFLYNSPAEIVAGMKEIIISRDALITDYFSLANEGAAFFNAATVMGIGLFLVIRLKGPFTGLTVAALFINGGFALWGKNIVNIWPILLGTILYAKLHGAGLQRYIYTALFGTCLGPFVTEMVFLLPFSTVVNLVLAAALGIFIGFVLPPLSTHCASMHMGYNLFNVGFAAGVLAFALVSVLQSFGLECDPIFIWREGRPISVVLGLYGFFLLSILSGVLKNRGDIKGIFKLMKHPGRAVADFVLMEGVGTTLINMGLVGIVCTTYILLIQGDFSGPVIGVIMTAYGFGAFGVHPKNYIPVLAGVWLSTAFSRFTPATPGIQLAAICSVALSPISGQFGVLAGVIAGMLHSAVVMCTSKMYGGLNLYNNGFSAGWVAIVMLPILESFMKGYYERKRVKSKKGDQK